MYLITASTENNILSSVFSIFLFLIESLRRLVIYVFYAYPLTIIGSMNPNNVCKVLNFHFVIEIILNNITSEAATRNVLIKKCFQKSLKIHRIRPVSEP